MQECKVWKNQSSTDHSKVQAKASRKTELAFMDNGKTGRAEETWWRRLALEQFMFMRPSKASKQVQFRTVSIMSNAAKGANKATLTGTLVWQSRSFMKP